MESKWLARAYREGDEEGIFELWKTMYPEKEYDREKWMRWWRWMYKDNPAGVGWIWLAECNNEIVGHSALIPVKMKIGTEIITSFQIIDAMTHPDYRGQGISKILSNAKVTEASEDGTYIGYGFPNELAYPVAIKALGGGLYVARRQPSIKVLNWANVTEDRLNNRFLSRIIAPAINLVNNKILFRAKRPPFVPGLEISQISSFDERINEFWNEISGQYLIMVVRNKDYLNWRYVTIPDVNYVIYIAQIAGKINGYLVFRFEKQRTKVCVIFDIMAQSERITQHLISKALEHCKRERADIIYCSVIANKKYFKAFRRSGFISLPFVKGVSLVLHSSLPHVPKEFLKDPKKWFVQIGDSDRL